MSDSGGVNVSKAGLKGGMIAAIIFCSLCIGYGLLETAKYERQANDKSREYAKYTRDKVAEACVGIPRLEKVKCLNEAIDAQREYETNQQDLATQKTSALWACIMGAAAVFGMALSALGVWLVKTTFDETRKANDIARTTAYRQLRPYVYFDRADFKTIKPTPMLLKGGIAQVLIKNYGQTPAYDVTIAISKRPFDYPLDPKIGLEAQVLETANQVVPPGHSHVVTAGFKSADVAACIKGEKCLTISVSVFYKFRDGNDTIAEDRIAQTFIFTKEEIDMGIGRPVLPTDYQTSGK